MRSSTSDLPPEAPQVGAGNDERKGAQDEEMYEEGREVAEEESFEEEDRMGEVEREEDEEEDEGKLEWPAGVAQASERDLVKLSHKEGVGTISSCSLLMLTKTRELPSILKRQTEKLLHDPLNWAKIKIWQLKNGCGIS